MEAPSNEISLEEAMRLKEEKKKAVAALAKTGPARAVDSSAFESMAAPKKLEDEENHLDMLKVDAKFRKRGEKEVKAKQTLDLNFKVAPTESNDRDDDRRDRGRDRGGRDRNRGDKGKGGGGGGGGGGRGGGRGGAAGVATGPPGTSGISTRKVMPAVTPGGIRALNMRPRGLGNWISWPGAMPCGTLTCTCSMPGDGGGGRDEPAASPERERLKRGILRQLRAIRRRRSDSAGPFHRALTAAFTGCSRHGFGLTYPLGEVPMSGS